MVQRLLRVLLPLLVTGALVGTSVPAALAQTVTPGTLQFSASTYDAGEMNGPATITVTRVGGSSGAVGATFSTTGGTATSTDYTATTAAVSFANGDSANKTVSIPILDDALSSESGETVTLALTLPTGGATLGSPSTATLNILEDNDTTGVLAGSLQFDASSYSVAETGGSATITVIRTGGTSGLVSAIATSSGGTAVAGTDYTALTATTGAVSFADGISGSQTVSIQILDDAAVSETGETVNLGLSSLTGGATLGTPSTAVLTINEDDESITGPPTGDNDRPGFGCGDENHHHLGPPANPGLASPCGHGDKDDVDTDDVVAPAVTVAVSTTDQDDHSGRGNEDNHGHGHGHGKD